MGFPIPFNQWVKNEAKDFVYDVLTSEKARNRQFIDNKKVIKKMESESDFGRSIWGVLCIELWQQIFHDKKSEYRRKLIVT